MTQKITHFIEKDRHGHVKHDVPITVPITSEEGDSELLAMSQKGASDIAAATRDKITDLVVVGRDGTPHSKTHTDPETGEKVAVLQADEIGKIDGVKVNGEELEVDENGKVDINFSATVDGTYSDTPTVTPTIGEDGIQLDFQGLRGNGIASSSEELSSDDGGTNTHKFIDNEGNEHVFHTKNGTQGRPGADRQPVEAGDVIIAHGTGDSEEQVMSQKATTDAINEGKIVKPSTETRSVPYYNGNSTVNWYVDASDGKFKTLSAGRSIELELTPDMKTIRYYATKWQSYNAGYAFVKDNGTYVSGVKTTTAGYIDIDAATPISQGATKFRCCLNTDAGSAISLTIYSETLEWPKRYTGTGSNEDGWMTQKAVTEAIENATSNVDGADIEDGSIALSKVASSAFDNAPTIGSNNLVRSKDIKAAVDAVSLDNYGKLPSVIGLSASATKLAEANSIIKSVRKLSGFPQNYTEARLQQIYAVNAGTHVWQIQIGYVVEGQATLQDVAVFGVSTPSQTKYTKNNIEIEVDWSALDAIGGTSTALSIIYNTNATNPYKVHFVDEDVYFDVSKIADGSIGVNKISNNSFDNVPTSGSQKLMRSKDIKAAIDAGSLDTLGKKSSIVGLTYHNATILEKANRIIKSVRKLSGFPQNYTEARLQQIYAINAGTHSWQIQIGYVVNGESQLQDFEQFGVNTLGVTKYQSSKHYTEIEVDWDALDAIGGTQTSLTIIFQRDVATNYYRVHFTDEDKYIGGDIIGDGCIGLSKLSADVRDKIDGSISFLKGKHLVTFCDSLGHYGTWQSKLAEITGMVFNSGKNLGRYSIGGTKTLGTTFSCGQGRALQLINDVDNNLIAAPDIIIIENVNDGSGNPGTITDESFILSERIILDNSHKQTSRANAITYWDENKATILASLTPKTGTILGIPYTTNTGNKLTITHAATANGSFGVLCTSEEIKYITVSAGDSIETIVDKIMQYNFDSHVAEKVGTDSIVFTRINGESDIAVYPNNTGITYTKTKGVEGTMAYYLFFKGHDVANWNTAANWVAQIPLYQAWKGMVEMLVNRFPNAVVYWLIPKCYQFNYADSQYTRADGTPDWDAMSINEYQSYLFENQIKMAKYMNIPILDIRQETCINPGNISTYFNANNVHPKTAGYYRWAEAIARLLT